MKTKLFLPFYQESSLATEKNDISDEQYAQQLLNMYDDGYERFMNQAMSSMMDARHGVMDVIPEKYAIDSVVSNDNVSLYEFECVLNNENDSKMSEDEFNFYAKSGEMCAFFVHITKNGTEDDDAVVELSSWLRECKNIMQNRNIDDGYKVGMLPGKDLIVEFPSIENMLTKRWKLVGARVIDQDNPFNFAIIVTKITEE